MLARALSVEWTSARARLSQILDLIAEDNRLNVYAGELEVRPPGAPTTPGMLGGGGPAAERRAFQARRSPTGQFVGRTRSTSIQRSRQASIGDSVPLERTSFSLASMCS